MRVRSDKPTRNGGYLHALRDDFMSYIPPSQPQPLKQTPKRDDVEKRANFFADLLHHLSLLDVHRENLNHRGLSDDAIDAHGYRSTPNDAAAANIVRTLAHKYDLAGIPGCYRSGDEWRLNFGTWNQGIIIPVCDTRERIRGLMIRRDEANAKPKYVWLSSKDKPDGASPGAPPHFTRVDVARTTGEMVITEGALKSSIISELTGEAVCGVAGVLTFGESFGVDLRRALPELRRVAVAYDADYRTNEAVRRGMTKMRQNLSAAGLSVSVRVWDASAGKGLDDVLAAAKGVTS